MRIRNFKLFPARTVLGASLLVSLTTQVGYPSSLASHETEKLRVLRPSFSQRPCPHTSRQDACAPSVTAMPPPLDFSFSLQHIERDPRYPAHWWTPVAKEGVPSWEILPQEAGPGEVILSKRNELGLLSNFAATPFTFKGKRYASLEGFWQMMKYPEGPNDARAKFPGLEWKYARDQVSNLTSFEAKSAGTLAEENMKKMGITWVTFAGKRIEYRPPAPGEHYRLIVAATREKVRQNPEVKKVLLATGDLILKPDHHQEPNPPAAWRYYEILTQIRSDLQKRR